MNETLQGGRFLLASWYTFFTKRKISLGNQIKNRLFSEWSQNNSRCRKVLSDSICRRYLLLLSRFSRVRLCNPMDCSPQGSSVHGIFQARVLEWVAIDFSEEVPIIVLFDKNARSYWTNIYSWVPAIVCLHVQEFGKDQQKHSVKINWLHQVYNKRCCIFYYYS